MRPVFACLVFVAACSSSNTAFDGGVPQRDVDNFDRWELCEGCVIGCASSGDVRCVPYGDAGPVGCDLCFAFCGRPGPSLPATAECRESVPYCGDFTVVDTPSCYRDLAR